MKRLLPLLLAILAAAVLQAAERPHADTVQLQFTPSSDVREILFFYEKITNRKVWVGVDVGFCGVSLSREYPVPKEEGIELIRQTLLDQAGIIVRDDDAGQTFVSCSKELHHVELHLKAIEMTRALRAWSTPSADRQKRIRITPQK